MARLKVAEIKKRLKKLDRWVYRKKAISKVYVRKDFLSAMDFVNEIVVQVDLLDHYPEIRIYSEKKVRVILTTATEDGVTDKDFVLAKLIDSFSKTEDIQEIPRPV